MGDLVNLRSARKKAARQRDQLQAAANRLAHGRKRAERRRDEIEGDKSRRHLDQHRIETGDEQ